MGLAGPKTKAWFDRASDNLVLGVSSQFCLRSMAVTLRFFGVAFRFIGEALVNLYDFVIFLPLWLETQIKGQLGQDRRPVRNPSLRETSL